MERQFPAHTRNAERTLETAGLRCAVGSMGEGAVRALEDLLSDGLLAIEAVDASPRNCPRASRRTNLQEAGFTDRQVEAALGHHQAADPQPADCWYRDDSGTKVDVEGKILTVALGLTESGEALCGMLSSVRERLRWESS